MFNAMQEVESEKNYSNMQEIYKRDYSTYFGGDVSLLTQWEINFFEDFKNIIDKLFLSDDHTKILENEERIDEMNVKLSIIKEIVETSIGHLREGKIAAEKLIHSYSEWQMFHKHRIIQLRELAESVAKTPKFIQTALNAIQVCSSVCQPMPLSAYEVTNSATSSTGLNVVDCRQKKAQGIIEEDRKYFQDMFNMQEHATKLEGTLSEFLQMDIVKLVFEDVKSFVEKGLKLENNDGRLNYIEEKLNGIITFVSQNVSQAVPKIVIGAIISYLVLIIVLLMMNKENQIMFACVSQSTNIASASISDPVTSETNDLQTADDAGSIDEAIINLEIEAEKFRTFYQTIMEFKFK